MERSLVQRSRTSTGSVLNILPPGEIIPGTRYRVIARVGAGAMGAVYLAEHVDLEKRVALKTLHAATASDPEAIERFRQEARAASKIGNPHICDVTDFGSLPDGEAFFVMEYIAGAALRRVLDAETALRADRTIAILRQICKALGAAHQKGIVHLDVKPDNIMLTTRGRRRDLVKVVDFGIAGLESAGTVGMHANPEDKVIGTPDYLAPERIRRKGYDHRSDIYSLGAMAYEMLTGASPFWNEDLMTTVTKHVTEKPMPLRQRAPGRQIPAALETVVLQMLEKEPAGRPQTMAVVEAMLCDAQIATKIQTDWDDLEIPEVDEAWHKKLTERMPSPRSRRHRRMALWLGGLALLGLGAALFLGLRRPREIISYKPVYVEVTKTDEAESVAPHLKMAAVAAEAEQFLEPFEGSALDHIEKAEEEARRLKVVSGGAASLRRLYGNQFRSLGNALYAAGLVDLAVLRYRQALRFSPQDSELKKRLADRPEPRRPVDKSGPSSPARVARSTPEEAAQTTAASLFAAVTTGHFSQARSYLAKLLETAPGKVQAARLADDFRLRSEKLWNEGSRSQARHYYQIVSELDPKDPVAKERATRKSEDLLDLAAASALGAESAKPTKAKWLESLSNKEVGMPRDRVLSSRFSREGQDSLSSGNLSRAEVAFTKAIQIDPTNPSALAGLAEVYFERARYTEALDYARRAIAYQPKASRYHMILGDAYFKLLRNDEALASYERAQSLSPSDDGIRARIDRVKARLRR